MKMAPAKPATSSSSFRDRSAARRLELQKRAGQAQPSPQVQPRPAAPPSLMDRPMGPGGGKPFNPFTDRPGPQINPGPRTLPPTIGGRPGLTPGPGSAGPGAMPPGMGPGSAGPGAMPPPDVMREIEMRGQQFDQQRQNMLSQMPAFQQMQSIQNQLQGRPPSPQQISQLQMLDRQIQSNPELQRFQQAFNQEMQQPSQLEKMQMQMQGPQQAIYGGPMGPGSAGPGAMPPMGLGSAGPGAMPPMGPGSAGPGAMPPQSMDMMYRPEVMPTVSPQQQQMERANLAVAQYGGRVDDYLPSNYGAPRRAQPFNQQVQHPLLGSGPQQMQQAQPLGPQQGMLQGFQQQPPVQPPQQFGQQPQQAQQAPQQFGQQPQQAMQATQAPQSFGQPQQAQQTKPAGGGGIM